MAAYPGSLFTKTVVADDPGGTNIIAAHHNSQDDEILAIETELGTDVAGSVTNLKTRLAVSLGDSGVLEFNSSTVLTVTSGAITVTQNWHRVATQGGAATDDLETINGLANDGTVLFLRPSTGNDIVVKHNVGNIVCITSADITLADTNEFAILIYDTNLSKWICGRMGAGSSVTTSAGAADNYVAIYTAAGNLEGTDDLQWSGITFTIGDGTAGRDYILKFDGETNDGVITWMEDEDYFKIDDDLLLPDNEAAKFGTGVDAAIKYDGTNLLITTDTVGTGGATFSRNVIVNEGGADADTRVEGDTDANLIYVDAGNDRVGIGTATPAVKLDVLGATRLGDSATNYAAFAADGELTLHGTARIRRELRIEATYTKNGASAPTEALRQIGTTATMLTNVKKFDKNTQNDVYFLWHVPFDCDTSVDATFHIIWLPGASWTAGNYMWKLEYILKTESAAYNTVASTVIACHASGITPANATAFIETEFPTGITLAADSILYCHIFRDVANDNGDDTGDLIMLELEYTANSLGEAT